MPESAAGAAFITVFIENSRGSTRKHIFNEESLVLERLTDLSSAYPYPYGFIMNTRSGDGDAIDCFVLTSAELEPGSTASCTPLALLQQVEDGLIDHKVLATLPGEEPDLKDAADQIRRFVVEAFSHVPGKSFEFGSVLDGAAAIRFVQEHWRSGS